MKMPPELLPLELCWLLPVMTENSSQPSLLNSFSLSTITLSLFVML